MTKKHYVALAIPCLGILLIFGCTGLMKAEMKLSGKKYQEAIPLYKEYLAEKLSSTQATSKLGFAYLKTGRIDDSIKEFETVLKAKPGEPYSVLYLGMAYLNKERFKDAIKIWQTYRDKKRPLVEEEIKRLLTLVQIAESQRSAQTAVANEEKLKTIKPDTNTVAVCYFNDLSPDKSLRAFQKGLAAMVITDLSKVKSLKIVERLRLQAFLEEMKLGKTGIVDAKTAPRLGRLLGAENLIVGDLIVDSIRATTSLASTGKGKVKGTSSVSVEKDKFFEMPALIIRDMARIMGIQLTPEEIKAIGVPHTKVYKAFIHFGEALHALDEGKWQKAKDLFALALKEDPKFSMAREGRDNSPGASSPGIGSLKSMPAPQFSTAIESAIGSAQKAQAEADAQAEAMSGGGGGGGDGGGGGGGGGGGPG